MSKVSMKSKQRKGGNRRGQQQLTIPRPPEIKNTGIVYTVRRRFLCINATTGVGQTITFANLLDSVLVATAATTGVQLFDFVKVREVEIWAPSTSAFAPVSVLLCFDGKTAGAQGDGNQHSATSMGATEPAHLRARPARQSQAAQFQPTSSATAFILTSPVNAIVDVTMTFRNTLDNGAVTSTGSPLTGATAGDVYFRALDGAAVAASKWLALGTVSIQ